MVIVAVGSMLEPHSMEVMMLLAPWVILVTLLSNLLQISSFKPFQNIIAIVNPGDRIIKLKNTNWCYIVTPKGDTSTSRVYSPTCDSIIAIWGGDKQ